MSVSRKLIKTPLGTVLYLWIEGGLVPYDVLRQEWLEDGRREMKKGPPFERPLESIPCCVDFT